MASEPLYERIGRSYATTRREDPRVAAQVHAALGDAPRVINVGAGTGSYEPADRLVVAVEPSPAMVAQRTGRTPLVVRGSAEALGVPSASFDAAMAILTIHHWGDLDAGLHELRRVSHRQVILFYEPLLSHGFWALDYFPEAVQLPVEQDAPGLREIAAVLDVREVVPVLVPADCVDGFGVAFWNRPEAYADPAVQAGMSFLALLPDGVRRRGGDQLLADIASGEWDRRHGHLRHETTFDGGYRLAICGA